MGGVGGLGLGLGLAALLTPVGWIGAGVVAGGALLGIGVGYNFEKTKKEYVLNLLNEIGWNSIEVDNIFNFTTEYETIKNLKTEEGFQKYKQTINIDFEKHIKKILILSHKLKNKNVEVNNYLNDILIKIEKKHDMI